MGDNEQKSVWEAEVVIWVKKREYVRRKPEVSETDWLSPLSVGYCASVSACWPQRLPPFFILLQHFSFFAFFLPPSSPLSTAVSFPCPVLFHCLRETLVHCWFLSLFRLCSPPDDCFSVMLTDTLLKRWFSARPRARWLCVTRALCETV